MKLKIKYYTFLAFLFFTPSSFAQEFRYDQDLSEIQYHTVEEGDNLYDIINLFNLGWDETLKANPDIDDPDLIYTNSEIIIPNHLIPDVKREGIVINIAELNLYYFKKDYFLRFPVSIGDDRKTPTGKTKVIFKRENPYWIPPESVRKQVPNLPKVVPAGPGNPLGTHALYLDKKHDDKWNGIMIHGTNKPHTIGSRVSQGCIRLYSHDIEILFEEVKIGTPVTIIDQPIKVAEFGNRIFLETHFADSVSFETRKAQAKKLICEKIDNCKYKVRWRKVDDAIAKNLGIPMNISFPTFKQDYPTLLTPML